MGRCTLQATQLINREDALVIDVRDPGEYGTGHILGARNVPLARIDPQAEMRADLGKHKDRPVIVYCDSGNRASKAAAALQAAGASRRSSTCPAGCGAWQAAGLPVEK